MICMLFYLVFRIKSHNITAATIDAMASDIGILIHTPVVPRNVGKISKPGIRNKT